MAELVRVQELERMIRETCLGGKIKKAEVRDEHALRGIRAQELQDTLANSHVVDVKHKGTNIVLMTDKGNSLVITMAADANVECRAAPVFFHGTDARVILHFDDEHTLDVCMPSLKDQFLFFPTTDLDRIEPLQHLGPEPQDILSEDFRQQMKEQQSRTIFGFLSDQHNVSGLSPADIDEICFQARVRADTTIAHLLRSQVAAIFDQMQKVIGRIQEVQGDISRLEEFGYLMPNRGNDRGCPLDGSGLQVLHFGQVRSYYCPKCQDKTPFDPKRMDFW